MIYLEEVILFSFFVFISFVKQVGLMKEKYDHRLLLKHLPSDLRSFLEHIQVRRFFYRQHLVLTSLPAMYLFLKDPLVTSSTFDNFHILKMF